MHKVISIIGNRPQFVKQAMFESALACFGKDTPLECETVNTGQHYDVLMSEVFFKQLGVAEPKYNLGVGSGAILDQIGKMLIQLGKILKDERPDAVLLYGDTNSTLAGAMAAAHQGIPCIHVEAGERLYRRHRVPEEINRVATDHLADLLLTCSQKASRYLVREGLGPDRVIFVGDLMLDLFTKNLPLVDERASVFPATYDLEPHGYILATLHRVETTSDRNILTGILERLDSAPLPVLLPMHPRISKLISEWGWQAKGSLQLVAPLGYFDFLALLRDAALVVSDSGGVTREALFAGKGCIVPLKSCWWTEAVETGLAVAIGQDLQALENALHNFRPQNCTIAQTVAQEFGDGNAADAIIREIVTFLEARNTSGQKEGAWHPLGYFDEIPAAKPVAGFRYENYRKILASLKGAGYIFTPFALPEAGPFCLLRHDIDFDIEKARDMARIEAEAGVIATYFLMVTSDHYNLAAPGNSSMIREILELGHRLGLHFDASAYEDLSDVRNYQLAIAGEAQILSTLFEHEVEAVSFHRPSPVVLEGNPDLSPGLLHSYDRRLQDAAEYVSDSGGEWKYGGPLDRDAFHARKPLHILAHPVWWADQPVSPLETLLALLDRRRDRDRESFARNCRPFRVGYLARHLDYQD